MKNPIVMFSLLLVVLLLVGCTSKSPSNPNAISGCGKDFDCFVEASTSCETSEVIHQYNPELFGVQMELTNEYKLKKDSGVCSFYIKAIGINAKYSEDLIQNLIASGMTPEEVDEQLAQASQANKDLMEGREGTCKGETKIISDMLKRWQQGKFSTKDYDSLDCQGAYFEI